MLLDAFRQATRSGTSVDAWSERERERARDEATRVNVTNVGYVRFLEDVSPLSADYASMIPLNHVCCLVIKAFDSAGVPQ